MKITNNSKNSYKPVSNLVTNHSKNPDWSRLNYKYCGLAYKLNNVQLGSVPPAILKSYNSYSDSYLDQCSATRDAFLTSTKVPTLAGQRIVGGVEELIFHHN